MEDSILPNFHKNYKLLTICFLLHLPGTQQQQPGGPQSVIIRNIGSGGAAQNLVITINQGTSTQPTQVVITPEVVQACNHGVLHQQQQINGSGDGVFQRAVTDGSGAQAPPPQIQVITNSAHQQVVNNGAGLISPNNGACRTHGVGATPQQQGNQTGATGLTPVAITTTTPQQQPVLGTTVTHGLTPLQMQGLLQGLPSNRRTEMVVTNAQPSQQSTTPRNQQQTILQQLSQSGHILHQGLGLMQQNQMEVVDIPLTAVLTKDSMGNVTPMITPQGVLAAYSTTTPPIQQRADMRIMPMHHRGVSVSSKNLPQSMNNHQQEELNRTNNEQVMMNDDDTNTAMDSTDATTQQEQQNSITQNVNSETIALATSMADQIIENLLESATTITGDEDCETCCTRCKCRCSCDCSKKSNEDGGYDVPSTTAQLEMNTPTFEVSSPPSFS